jgi:steroid delta-isomerase-like uncharacterized protein
MSEDSPQKDEGGSMSAEENKAVIVRALDALTQGNLDIIDEVFSPTFAFHSPYHPHWPRGLEGARKMISSEFRTIPDLQATVEDIFAEGDKVAVRWTFRGTYRGEPKPGLPAPGERITTVGISTYRFANGKIEEDWGVVALWQTGKVWE